MKSPNNKLEGGGDQCIRVLSYLHAAPGHKAVAVHGRVHAGAVDEPVVVSRWHW